MNETKRPLFSLEEETEAYHHPDDPNAPQEKGGAEEESHQPVPVAIVDVHIPLSSIIGLFFRVLVVLIPTLVILGVALNLIWRVATLQNF